MNIVFDSVEPGLRQLYSTDKEKQMSLEKFDLKLGKQFLVALDIVDPTRREVIIEKIKKLGASETFNQMYSIYVASDVVSADIERVSDFIKEHLGLGDKLLFINAKGDHIDGTFLLSRETEEGLGINVAPEDA